MKKQVYNPYLPSYEYIPDGEPRVFGDRLYIFGSHDHFGGTDYCQNDYVCWSTPVNDLSSWRYEGVIYRKDQHPYKVGTGNLYAPDVTQGLDGRYYLYYSVGDSCVMSVAVSDVVTGPYEYYGDVKDKTGHVLGSSNGDFYQFDPSIFIDDDNRIFLYSGFNPPFKKELLGRQIVGAFVMELYPDMVTVKEGPTIIMPKKNKNVGLNQFFEASSVRKINGIYYFVYFSVAAGGLCYATSPYPDRDFVYRGVIHSNSDLGINGHSFRKPAYPLGNNHGGMVCLNGQSYIFNHRMTNRSPYSRQGIAEPIKIHTDGRIDQVEMTSCGLNGGPLIGKGEYPAHIACCLMGKPGLFGIDPKKSPYMTQEGEDRENNPNQFIAFMKNGSLAGFKYFNFDKVSRIAVKVRGEATGEIRIRLHEKGNDMAVIKISPTGNNWTDFSSEFTVSPGVHPIYFIFKGKGAFDFMSFTIE